MRRVTLATELINYPSILFAMSPLADWFLHGGDGHQNASGAGILTHSFIPKADNGVTVICTIHQPPTETYALFDRVMYLADGEVAFFGRRDEAVDTSLDWDAMSFLL